MIPLQEEDGNEESYEQEKTCTEHLLWIKPSVRGFHMFHSFTYETVR